MSVNPYQTTSQDANDAAATADTIRKIRGPSTGLILLLGIQIAGYIFAALLATIAFFHSQPVGVSPAERLLAIGHFAVMVFMLWAILQIRQLRHLRFGRIAAGLACIPMVSPWIWFGIPFGIWLSVLLASPRTVDAAATQLPSCG